MKKETFPISGMHCASCSLTVEKALKQVDGVKDATVNYASEKATIEYDESRAQVDELKKAVDSTGYKLIMDNNISTTESSHQMHGMDNMKMGEIPMHDHASMLKEDEIRSLWHKFSAGFILAIPIFILSFPTIFGIDDLISAQNRMILAMILATPVQFWVGWQFYRNTLIALKNFFTNMDTLIAIGTSSAFFYSAVATIFPQIFESSGVVAGGYFDTATIIITLIILGRYMEAKAKGRASDAIKKLMKLSAKTAMVIRDNNQEIEIPINELKIGDIILVRPGEKIPTD
ncbi:MAG: cation-transporting ATPase PacS, partial [Candidatus Portnoybacteria bacterium CG10_big_fil_rev_8_21_14_0_10_36_7]